ncbi:unnamed protein product [Zymoseptoria tritici ST99CH_1E4]|uniref:Uncharacterized protein n=1 Tax=Zymoseptoria tritici ST99CH_1E4 TaxID=1276532 RepID=A0A2H1GCQ6_ZYMTR|nr:unnamed protein product [Zymoseptoria tritici ST99CH_1E4]
MANVSTNIKNLDSFQAGKTGAYNPGDIRIWYDNRTFKGFEDKLSRFQSYYLSGLSYLNRPSLFFPRDLVPGNLRIIWYTHAGAQGERDWPLHEYLAVKEMFDYLSEKGFRPMVLGYSEENPFPMLGGVEPPKPKKRKAPRVATTWSNHVAGHSEALGGTPHDRVMRIIEEDEAREARLRELQVQEWGEENVGRGGSGLV